MKRLAIIVMALLACAACLGIAEIGVGQIGPWLMIHDIPRWFVPACNVFTMGCLVFVALRRKKSVAGDDERLTPLVRRDPNTGLRQL